MDGYRPCFRMFYQFVVPSNIVTPEPRYYPTFTLYPQFVPIHINNFPVQSIPTEMPANLSDPSQKLQEIQKPKLANQEPIVINEPSKNTIQPQSNVTKQQLAKKQSKKPKRPQKYLTEKAFYMKQKLKGKQKTGIRILRKRQKSVQVKKNIVSPEKKVKKNTDGMRIKRKKISTLKDSFKQKKILNKIKSRLLKQCSEQFAQIPSVIVGIREINEFCRVKFQNLMTRRVVQELN